MPRVDDQHEADERLACGEVAREKFLPVPLEIPRHGGVTVARQVGEQRAAAQAGRN